jgi:drug/metabolite transporter (DMT)-like permease
MNLIEKHPGEFCALLTAIFWTITALSFESASLKVGSLAVNLIRLLIGFIFLSIYSVLVFGRFLPTNASLNQWTWLSISGFIGFFLGDLFLFKSYTIIGSRIAMLVMALVPPITALLGWIILHEKLTWMSLLGMAITLTGISVAILTKESDNSKFTLKFDPLGLLYALGGAFGQSLGLVLSKFGMKGYNAFAATQIRIISGILGFTILISILKRWSSISAAFSNNRGMMGITLGAFFGPFLGVSFSLLSIKYTKTGIASTIMAIVPVLIIAPAIIFLKQKVTIIEILGAIISVFGIILFFL